MFISKTKLKGLQLPEDFTITAHSGAFDTPDNSEEFVKRAVKENCSVIELDVTFRPSGRPVMIHSDSPSENEGTPLENAFAIIARHPSIKMNLDLKSLANLPALDKMLREFGLFERAFCTGVYENQAPIVKANSAVPYYINVETNSHERCEPAFAEEVAEHIIAAGGLGINSHYDSVSNVIVRAVHGRGLKVSVWTANDVRAMQKCLKLLPDNITTRHPDMLKNLIERV